MGNCFGKTKGNFQGEGRTLSANPTNAPASANNPRTVAPPPKISSPHGGKTLGRNPQAPAQSSSPGEAAARAAEERAKATQTGKGKLGRQLDNQRSQTQKDTLAQTARDNVAARDADVVAQARNYN